jgi:pSer/pThr/pTyr-binding forkhead associated (FHA) protein
MGSTNGTFVNRRRVGDMQLANGDQIRIGVTVLAFEIIEG